MGPMVALALCLIVALTSACATRVPTPQGLPAGTAYVSWVFMTGDADNPDRDFVCQSDPRTDCAIDASRSGAQSFSDLHFYFHSAGGETKYDGTTTIGFFEGSSGPHTAPTSVIVRKGESMTNQSVTGIVTSRPGTYAVTLALTAVVTDTGQRQPIRQSVQVIVK